MATGLVRLREMAKRDKQLRFNNLLHHVTLELLSDAYYGLNRHAASGVDEESWQSYGSNLSERLGKLHEQIQRERYRPYASKRLWIPKADGRQRPIGIAAVEDKIVQAALVKVLESIYEEDFLGLSYGFRPGRNPHRALDALYCALTEKKVSWVLDADIQGFFDHLDHDWLMRFIQHRISDQRIHRLIAGMLNAGVVDAGQWTETRVGTPQGAVISPLLANIYLHYVLDLWIHHWRRHHARGEVYVVRYADDFVVGFQYRSDGEALYKALQERMAQFGLRLHEDKTRLIEFGRFAIADRRTRGMGKPETFNFLGFTHICARRGKDGGFTVRRHTIAQRQRQKQQQIREALMRCRSAPVSKQGRWLKRVVTGWFNYFGVPGNRKSLDAFRTEICRAWFRALRRRGQKKRINWVGMQRIIRSWIPSAQSTHPFPNQRFHV